MEQVNTPSIIVGPNKTGRTLSVCFMSFARNNNLQQTIDWINEHYDMRINAGTHQAEFKEKDQLTFRPMTEEDFNDIRIRLSFDGISISSQNLYSVIHSRQFPNYDPYLSFLSNLPEYDLQHDYIAELADMVQCEDQSWWQLCLRKWLVAVVASLADNKVNQFCPILCSAKQGIGKSTFLRYLIPKELKHYVFEGKVNPSDKDSLVYLSSCAFINLDEAESLSKKNIEATKRMITQDTIRVRVAYARESSNFARRASFMGSSNDMQLLCDSANRRFGCFKVNSVNLDALHKMDIHQVYAQAYQLYRTGYKYWFDDEEINKINQHNSLFRYVSMEEEIISTYLEPCDVDDPEAQQMAAHELLPRLQSLSNVRNICKETIGRTLSRLGFIQKKSNNVRKWIFKLRC